MANTESQSFIRGGRKIEKYKIVFPASAMREVTGRQNPLESKMTDHLLPVGAEDSEALMLVIFDYKSMIQFR
jgi:hypothetical protein